MSKEEWKDGTVEETAVTEPADLPADGEGPSAGELAGMDAASEEETAAEHENAAEDSEGVSDGSISIEEKIEAAMAKIVTDTVGSTPVPEETAGDSAPRMEESPEPQGRAGSGTAERTQKSARPAPVTYVQVDDDLPYPVRPGRKKHKGLKVTGIVAAMLVVTAGCAYGALSYYYSDKFFEGTVINGIDCSGKTPYEVEQDIAARVEDYSIQVASRNLAPQTISGSEINYRYMSSGEILALQRQQKPYEWVKGLWEQRSYTTAENISYDQILLQDQIRSLECAKEENQVAPANAYVAFHDTQFEIVPETEGNELDIKNAYRMLEEAVSASQPSVDFSSNPEAYVKAAVTRDDPELLATADACNNYTRASITYTFGDESVTLDGTTIKNWLQFDEKGQLVRDDVSFQQHIADFVAQLAYDHDTVGTEREFYTTSGRVVYVWGSAYGWQINQSEEVAQLTQEIQSGTQTVREPIYSMTANAYGPNDLGDTYIEVDLSAQHMYYYQDGYIIFDSDFVSGNMSYADRQTPSGIYTLYNKKSPETLRGPKRPDGTYEYETPVTFWMPFNGGIGFHDATWQPYFGGDRYLTGGSHGCINLPYESAAVLYDIIQYGVPIICFY